MVAVATGTTGVAGALVGAGSAVGAGGRAVGRSACVGAAVGAAGVGRVAAGAVRLHATSTGMVTAMSKTSVRIDFIMCFYVLARMDDGTSPHSSTFAAMPT
jgi:hypothetical protein